MANVSETATFEEGIYQIETTDPVLGGVNGIANVQAKQLANRTVWLKERADLVDEAAGGHPSLSERLNVMTAEMTAISPPGGTVTIRNTGVISGCNVSAGGTGRLVNLTAGKIFLNGIIIGIEAQVSTASIAQNTGGETGYVDLYIDPTGDLKATNLNQEYPAGTMLLYRVTVPAGNTVENLAGCTLSKVANTQDGYPQFVTALPSAPVVLPYEMDTADYHVSLEVVGYTGAETQFGSVKATDKTTTGFNITFNGTADSVIVNWTARKLNI